MEELTMEELANVHSHVYTIHIYIYILMHLEPRNNMERKGIIFRFYVCFGGCRCFQISRDDVASVRPDSCSNLAYMLLDVRLKYRLYR